MTAAIVCSDLSFSWPDGASVLSGLTVSFGPGRTGLIGVNGSGKSTLLKLIAGELRPDSGAVRTHGEVGYLPQAIALGTHQSVSDLLGITVARDALQAIEAGETGEDVFAAIGDDWDVEERARAWLDRLGLDGIGLDDRVERLSGGETIGVALAALFLRRPDILLLDEPTNNLDLDARKRLYDAVASWTGVMVIVSHDRELLALMDQIADLAGGEIRMYGGNLDAYEELLATEQAAAERAVSSAAADVRREQRDLVDAQVKQARHDRMGRKVAASGGLPKIVAYARKRAAQETAGRSRGLHSERLETARGRLAQAEEAVRDDTGIRIELPDTALPAGRTVLHLTGLADTSWHPASASRAARLAPVPASEPAPAATAPECEAPPVPAVAELIVRGPERIALTGPNGAGKTTLLRAIAGLAILPGVTVRPGAVTGYLPQRLDILDDSLSVVDNVRAAAPAASVNEVRAGLARFLFRGDQADRLVSTLSGGERFRAVLAALLLAQPAPQLLLLDEPTNNLDMASVRQLSQALDGYRGALLVASHDVGFLRSAGITRWLRLDRETGLAETGLAEIAPHDGAQ
ncbi:MAG TPA: ABC-F family ATP-binding cassette domain-containing protein [Streptosporangiaceae bacterium]|nr:ABC-F family ATP-binding cassette domain-containing protein [Streptosporangiaceae bacterium]